MPNHQKIKDLVDSLGIALTPAESLYVRAVALSETSYGEGWTGDGVGSNNMGAITQANSSTAPYFEHGDTLANGKKYVARFTKYATPEDGLKALASLLLKPNVKSALAQQNFWAAVSAQIDANHYTGDPPATPTSTYGSRLQSGIRAIVAATGEPLPFHFRDTVPAPPLSQCSSLLARSDYSLLAVIRVGAYGPDVAWIQTALGCMIIDGHYGPGTAARVQIFQRAHALKADGIVGARTWAALASL